MDYDGAGWLTSGAVTYARYWTNKRETCAVVVHLRHIDISFPVRQGDPACALLYYILCSFRQIHVVRHLLVANIPHDFPPLGIHWRRIANSIDL